MRSWLEPKLLSLWSSKNVLSDLLLPFSCLYGFIAQRNAIKKLKNSWRAPVPVIVVGNIMIGGTGKTPVTISLCKALQQSNWKPGIVSRGYGVKITNEPHLSDTDINSSYLGDEPSLIYQATKAPIAVHPERSKAAQALLKAHPEVNVLISDDGLQHVSLQRDIEIIVQDERLIGNGRLIPAGPLREPAARLNTVDYIVNNVSHLAFDKLQMNQSDTVKNVYMCLQAEYVTHLQTNKKINWPDWFALNKSNNHNAIAGIGQPNRFFEMLKQYGLKLDSCITVADHQAISRKTLDSLGKNNILITAKDAVKFQPPYDDRLFVVHVGSNFNDNKWLNHLFNKLSTLSS